jgi:hypothetical protein
MTPYIFIYILHVPSEGLHPPSGVNQQPPVHYPLEACYDSVVDEPHPSDVGFHLDNLRSKKAKFYR